MERRLIHLRAFDAGFGVTVDDNSIHRANNEGLYDNALGVTARSARHVVDFGNNLVAGITGHQRRHAFQGPFGATRARVMDVLTTPINLVTKDNKLGTLANGVMGAFDVAANAAIVDPLTMAAGDHANAPERTHVLHFSQEEQNAAPNN